MKKILFKILIAISISFAMADYSHAVWSVETIDTGGTGDVGMYSSITLDASGYAYISYYDKTNNRLKYATNKTGSWVITANLDPGGTFTSIALDSGNTPHISYISGNNLRYLKIGSSPTTVTTATHHDPDSFYTSIAIDTSNNYPRISYTVDPNPSDVRYSYYDGATWQTEIFSSADYPLDSSLALPSNNPYVAYVGGTSRDIHIARRTGPSTWVLDSPITAIAQTGAYWPCMKFNGSGNPCVSYTNFVSSNGDLRYAKWGGASWTDSPVDTTNNTGWWSSLELDNNNYAHISYHDDTKFCLRYATDKSGSFVTTTVDALAGVGYFNTSIKLDSSYNPRIAYYDYTNKDLKYAKYVPGTFSVSGYVRVGGTPLSNATVYLTGPANANYVTAGDGYYVFTDIGATNVTVVAASAGYVFTPNYTYTPLGSSQTNQDFVGTLGTGYFLRGYVTQPDGTPIPDVLVSLQGSSPGSDLTDSSGFYEFINLPAGSYTVTPTRSQWVFVPENRIYNSFSSNQDSQNFRGVPENIKSYIRGYIKDSSGKPIKDVVVDLVGKKVDTYTTGEDGYYIFSELSFRFQYRIVFATLKGCPTI